MSTTVDLAGLTVKELRRLLGENGLPKKGKKHELVRRLGEHLKFSPDDDHGEEDDGEDDGSNDSHAQQGQCDEDERSHALHRLRIEREEIEQQIQQMEAKQQADRRRSSGYHPPVDEASKYTRSSGSPLKGTVKSKHKVGNLQPKSQSVESTSASLQQQMLEVLSLPKPQLMTFDGNPLKYHVFMSLFDSSVHRTNISDAAKLNRLFELCKGKALKVIEPCALGPPTVGYKEARRLLSTRFGNDYEISEAYVNKLVTGPTIGNNDVAALQDFADDVRSCALTLRAMKKLDEVDTRSRLVRLVERLPYYLQGRWRKQAVEERLTSGKYPNIDSFLLFLDRVSTEMSDPVFGVKSSGKQQKNNAKGGANKSETKPKSSSFLAAEKAPAEKKPPAKSASAGKETSVNSGSKPERRCPQCDGQHPVYMCPDFRAMTPEKRLEVATSKRLCFNCLKVAQHSPQECRVDRVCNTGECKVKHSYLLHDALATATSTTETCAVSNVNPVPATVCTIGVGTESAARGSCKNAGVSDVSYVRNADGVAVVQHQSSAKNSKSQCVSDASTVSNAGDVVGSRCQSSVKNVVSQGVSDPSFVSNACDVFRNSSQSSAQNVGNLCVSDASVVRNKSAASEICHQSSLQNSASVNVSDASCVSNRQDSSAFRKVALPMVPVVVRGTDQADHPVKTYALLDSGSTSTFCSEKLIEKLHIKGNTVDLSLNTVEGGKELRATVVNLVVTGSQRHNNGNSFSLQHVYAIKEFPHLMNNLAKRHDVETWNYLKGLPYRDDEAPHAMLIIGQDHPELLKPLEVQSRNAEEPVAVRTQLGWAISGPVGKKTSCNFCASLDEKVERFWRLDNAGVDVCSGMSVSDASTIRNWDENAKVVDSHYVLEIPFKHEEPDLPDNKQLAERRLEYLGKRLKKDEALRIRYKQEIDKLVEKQFAEKIKDSTATKGITWYIPHHGVLNPNKPDKLRVVNDCSAKFDGVSLNSSVHQGPDLTNKLIGVLLRFRQKQYAIMSDVEAMYHQVVVPESQRDALRFLWWQDGDPNKPVEIYRMTRHLFGGIWSASAANYALKRTALDNASQFDQDVVDAVLQSFYVDDLLHAVDTEDSGIRVSQQIQELLAKGGFNLDKWVSSSRKILESVPEEKRAKSVQSLDLNRSELPVERALGLVWHTDDDTFKISVKPKDPVLTRRGLLSYVSSVYDPLGIVCPFVLIAKKLFQDETRLKKDWDAALEPSNAAKFLKWLEMLPLLREVTIPRWMMPGAFKDDWRIELHHFADASSEAYGTASYIRVTDSQGNVTVRFIFGKSRLAPLKAVTIPRLELMAAVIAVNIDQMLRQELTLSIASSYFWTDSTCVLAYIRNVDRKFSVFVANRVAAIHQSSVPDQWKYVPTALNPGDDASRGVGPAALQQRWLNGPEFLYKDEASWPQQHHDVRIQDTDPEVKSAARCHHVGETTPVSDASFVSNAEDPLCLLFRRYSSWYRLKRGVAWIQRFIQWWVNKKQAASREITTDDLERAANAILRYDQIQFFSKEFKELEQNKTVSKSSKVYKLEPFKGKEGLIRVGGRLTHAPISDASKNQLLLSQKSHVSMLIVREAHEVARHSGVEYVLSLLRDKYWIVSARSLIKSVIAKCVVCKILYSTPRAQRMGDLPSDRLQSKAVPFTNVGIDAFGPFYVKRGRAQEKRYGLVFTCLVMRAVHIEVLHSLDADSFISALMRFRSRRGQPELIRCDNGTNFVAGSRELATSIEEWNDKVQHHLTQANIKWVFNPPAASHMGGAWERQIRSIRRILNAVIYNAVLDDERLSTALCEVESIINNRPITSVSADPRDAEPLTPNHLLLLRKGAQLPLGNFTMRDAYGRRWRHAQYLADRFWKRWIREYISTIQHRQKWLQATRDFKVNDIVLVADENTPRNCWPIARITEVFTGRDKHVRSAMVKTRYTTLKRPVTKLCFLEEHNA